MLSFFPRDVLDEIWDLIEPVSEGFPTYSIIIIISQHEHCVETDSKNNRKNDGLKVQRYTRD